MSVGCCHLCDLSSLHSLLFWGSNTIIRQRSSPSNTPIIHRINSATLRHVSDGAVGLIGVQDPGGNWATHGWTAAVVAVFGGNGMWCLEHIIPYLRSGWWCNNHLEKYEFVNGKDYPIYEMENKKCLKPPTRYYIILLYHIIPPKTCQCEATFHTDSMLGFFFQPISRKIGQYGPVRWKKHMFETTTRSTSIYRFSAPNDWVWVKFGYMDI